MLTPEIEKEIIDQLVKSTTARNLIKKDTREYVDDDYYATLDKNNEEIFRIDDDHYYEVRLETASEVTITLTDDFVIEGTPSIIIDFVNDTEIEVLTINIESGKYHEKGEYVGGAHRGDLDIDTPCINFRTNNKIRKLIVNQIMCTENIYSYRRNQDGHNPREIYVKYNPTKYNDICIVGASSVKTGEYTCISNREKYDLSVMLLI